MIRVNLKNGTVIECDSAEEAAKFIKKTSKDRQCPYTDCDDDIDNGPHCSACGHHHSGMC